MPTIFVDNSKVKVLGNVESTTYTKWLLFEIS